MIDDPRGRIDYAESGAGPTVVLLPGSCATGAAWRPIVDAWVTRRWGRQYSAVGPALFRYGFVFAVGLTLLPVAVIGLGLLARLIF